MSLHKEIEFENEICAHLAANGWLYADGDAQRYDRERALYPDDLVAWIQQTQPQAWEALEKTNGAAGRPRCWTGCASSSTTAARSTCCEAASS